MLRITLAVSVPIAVADRLMGRTGWGPQASGEGMFSGTGTQWGWGQGCGNALGYGGENAWQAGGYGWIGIDCGIDIL